MAPPPYVVGSNDAIEVTHGWGRDEEFFDGAAYYPRSFAGRVCHGPPGTCFKGVYIYRSAFLKLRSQIRVTCGRKELVARDRMYERTKYKYYILRSQP